MYTSFLTNCGKHIQHSLGLTNTQGKEVISQLYGLLDWYEKKKVYTFQNSFYF